MILQIFILALMVIVSFHFVYESAIAPTLRQQLRNKIFVLRDRLRMVRYMSGNPSDKAFDVVETSLNNAIHNLVFLDLSSLRKSRNLVQHDQNIEKLVKSNYQILTTTKEEDLKAIDHALNKYMLNAFLVNSGALTAFLFPLLMIIYSGIKSGIKIYKGIKWSVKLFAWLDKKVLKEMIQSFLLIPEKDMKRVAI